MSLLFVYFDFSLNSKVLIVALNKHVTSDEQILAGAQITKYGIGLHIQKEQEEKCSLAKNRPVKANWGGGERYKHFYVNLVILQ